MSHNGVESVIGKLVTDERFRERFFRDARAALDELKGRGCEVTAVEIAALITIDAAALDAFAAAIDPRPRSSTLRSSTFARRDERTTVMERAMAVLVQYGYVVVLGGVFAEQVGMPLPSEPVLIGAGALAGNGHLSLAVVLGVATVASLAGDLVWYVIGRLGGARVLRWLCRISLEPDACVRRTERFFARHGARSLLVAKFVPGFSMAAPPLAGIVRMPVHEFVIFTGLGGVVWASAFLGLGWIFRSQLAVAGEYAARLGGWTVAVVVAAIVAHLTWKIIVRQRFLRKIRIARITPEELKARLDGGEPTVVVDVRDRVDFEAEPSIIPGALHLTTDELEARHREIPRERDIVLYCT